ncbi:Gfo/Idh/MocA family protein [Methylobacterium nigriterrae]|uniref:Gfo/Idh/MocA family protein n=1 Tax=Methylobacterium nigriterrae TaxID=3127512 RepID=UPI003013E925
MISKEDGRKSDPIRWHGNGAVRVARDRPSAVHQREVRVGVVGCGYWGAKHVRVLSATPGVAELSLIERDVALCDNMQRVFPGTRAFRSLEAALPHVDAVVIATPPQTHGELALMAVREGKHVLVEKPLVTSLGEAESLVEAARLSDRITMVGHTFQFNPAVRELRRRMVSGELGKIYYIHSARLNLGLYRPDVNVVWDLAPHDVSILNYLLDSRPDSVMAWGASLAFGDVHDLAYLRLEYREPEVTGYAHVSWLDPRKTRTVTVVGSEKMAIYDDLSEDRLRIYDCGLEGHLDGPPLHERPPAYRYGDMIVPYIRPDEPLALQDKHFIDSIRTRTEPETDWMTGLSIVAILEALHQSIREGRPVSVSNSFARSRQANCASMGIS